MAPRSKCRQRLTRRLVDLQLPAGLSAAPAHPPAAPEPNGHDHPLAAERNVGDRRAGQAEHPVECGLDAQAVLLRGPLSFITRQPATRTAARPAHSAQPPKNPQARKPCSATGRRGSLTPNSTGDPIIIAAEVTIDSPDFGHLEPMVDATQRELEAIGVSSPETVVADPGYWHKQQMENVVSRGIQVLIRRLRVTHRTAAGVGQGPLRVRALGAFNRSRPDGLPKTDGHRRARVRAGQAQPRVPALPPARTLCRALRVSIRSSDPQPVEAPQTPDRRHRRLKRPRRQPIRPDTANPAPRPSAPRTPLQPFGPTATPESDHQVRQAAEPSAGSRVPTPACR